MANKNISGLTAATTPLAGTELVPVWDGATKKVTVANLTAGRDVSLNTGLAASGSASLPSYSFTASNNSGMFYGSSYVQFAAVGNIYIQIGGATVYLNYPTVITGNVSSTGNFIPTTAAKGINFTANTPAAGMTSQLLNWYEEGTWTVTWANLTGTPTNTTAYYTRVGRLVTFTYSPGAASISGTANSASFTLSHTPTKYSSGTMINASVASSGVTLVYTDGKCYPSTFSSGNMVFSGTFTI